MTKKFSSEVLRKYSSDILSYGGLILCILIFSFLSEGKLWSAYNIKALTQSAAVYAVLALGAVFIYSMGCLDISLSRRLTAACGLFLIDDQFIPHKHLPPQNNFSRRKHCLSDHFPHPPGVCFLTRYIVALKKA
jgi:hypothetical protein